MSAQRALNQICKVLWKEICLLAGYVIYPEIITCLHFLRIQILLNGWCAFASDFHCSNWQCNCGSGSSTQVYLTNCGKYVCASSRKAKFLVSSLWIMNTVPPDSAFSVTFNLHVDRRPSSTFANRTAVFQEASSSLGQCQISIFCYTGLKQQQQLDNRIIIRS